MQTSIYPTLDTEDTIDIYHDPSQYTSTYISVKQPLLTVNSMEKGVNKTIVMQNGIVAPNQGQIVKTNSFTSRACCVALSVSIIALIILLSILVSVNMNFNYYQEAIYPLPSFGNTTQYCQKSIQCPTNNVTVLWQNNSTYTSTIGSICMNPNQCGNWTMSTPGVSTMLNNFYYENLVKIEKLCYYPPIFAEIDNYTIVLRCKFL